MSFLARYFVGLFTVMCVSACYNASNYCGDGYLDDRGLFEARYRYVLTVDEIEIGKQGQFEYTLLGLPTKAFAFGLEVELPRIRVDENPREHLPCNPVVRIQIMDPSKEGKALDLSGHIASDWTWSITTGSPSAFLYIRENGAKRFKPASRHQQYTMEVRVHVPPEESCELKASLVAKSRGWK